MAVVYHFDPPLPWFQWANKSNQYSCRICIIGILDQLNYCNDFVAN